MNILIVSTYPPMPCGIGKYAKEQADSLRGQGHRVDVLSTVEGDAEFQDDLLGGWHPLRLLRYAWAYDDVFIHYTPQFFYLSEDRGSRIKTSLAFLLIMLLCGRKISFLLHETGFKVGIERRGRTRYLIDRWYWRLAQRIIFHSYRERDAFGEYYRLDVNRPRFEVFPHDKYMVRRCDFDQAEARRQLNQDPDATLLLCIGFIQPHKGFDRAIRALAHVEAPQLRLRIVGSVRLVWDKAHQYAQLLHDLADNDGRVAVHEAYLSDELFETWILAADYIVIPYHEIWTSGVAARAKLYHKPLVAINLGGLAEQLTPGSFMFETDAELVEIFRQIGERPKAEPAEAAGEAAAGEGAPVDKATVDGAAGNETNDAAQVQQLSLPI